MSDHIMDGGADNQQRLKRALLALKEMQARLDHVQQERHEPIAVIGIGCRFPGGVVDPDSFWNLLRSGTDAISEVPSDRWDIGALYDPDPDAPGKMYVRHGGFLDRMDEFDAHFFGMAPREANWLDPQQRLLVEVTWEALERTGIAPARLAGSLTGVFIGISSTDYSQILIDRDPAEYDLYMGSGNAHSVAAGRISYLLGLQGPCVALDTACSSSLVAVHMACQSLRARECHLALAEGVNLILTPVISINHCRAKMLAPDGRCKTFDATADGFARSEGCGAVVLKRLSDALAEGDPILAVIRGTATNQDGRTSGLTVPNGPSQSAVIRKALRDSNLQPQDIDYIEAHGTGTALGDPIEVGALGEVFASTHTKERPLVLGSVKTNIGHAEAAAGIAGLIKTILALQHHEIPPHIHFHNPNPLIAWNDLPFRVPVQSTPWPSGERSRYAGVSSFGFGGTNAHVIVQEAPPRTYRTPLTERSQHILSLSAKSDTALQQLAGRYSEWLASHPEEAIGDICFTVDTGRSHYAHRLSVIGTTSDEICKQLVAFQSGVSQPGINQGYWSGTDAAEVIFLFTGQGAQYRGMGRELYETQPLVKRILDRCDSFLRSVLEKPLLSVMFSEDGDTTIDRTVYTQPAMFALEYALAELWKSWGVLPAAVIGHSVGEYAAACVAGAFSLEDGLKLIAERARLMQSLPENGAMTAVLAEPERILPLVETRAGVAAVAAFNGPRNVVISGLREAIADIVTHLERDGVTCKPLQVSHAFHSPLMDPILDEFERFASTIEYASPQVDLVSNLTGNVESDAVADAQYWRRHIRQPVQFASGLQTLSRYGYRNFLEIGPKPVLLGMARQCLSESDAEWMPSLRPGHSDWRQLCESLGALYVRGVRIDWDGFERDYPRNKVVLPTYPFQRKRYWIESAASGKRVAGELRPQARGTAIHPLVQQRVSIAALRHTAVFETRLHPDSPPYLKHHRVFDRLILPGSVYCEMALAAGKSVLRCDRPRLESISFKQSLVVSEDCETIVQIIVEQLKDGTASWKIYILQPSAQDNSSGWMLHAEGTVNADDASRLDCPQSLAALQARITQTVEVPEFYSAYRDRGVEFGPLFQAIERLWRGETDALALLKLPPGLLHSKDDYDLHPVLLDAAAQVLGAVFLDSAPKVIFLQTGMERLLWNRPLPSSVWAYARLNEDSNQNFFHADLWLMDDSGACLAEINNLVIQRAGPETFGEISDWLRDKLYSIAWLPKPKQNVQETTSCLEIPSRIAECVRPSFGEALGDKDIQAYGAALAKLDRWSVNHILAAFQKLGWNGATEKCFSLSEFMQHLSIHPRYERLVNRLLRVLEEHGILQCRGDMWQVMNSFEAASFQQQPETIPVGSPQAEPEFTLLRRCGSMLGEILRGDCDPLSLIFPNGDASEVTRIYRDSPGAGLMNGLLQKALVSAIARWPLDRPLRIIEIGAGTGGTASYILPHLPADRTDYLFTDISPLFLSQAQAKFQTFPFLRRQILDIERSPSEQGVTPHTFEIVIAFNVLHATKDLRRTLAHVRDLLVPGGELFLLENTSPMAWVELIWGLTDGWWRFTDFDLRPNHPLLDTARWTELLKRSGFRRCACITPDPQRHPALAKQAVFIAQRSESDAVTVSSEPVHWIIFTDSGLTGERLKNHLNAKGCECTLVERGHSFASTKPGYYQLNPADRHNYTHLWRDLLHRHPNAVRGIVYLWGLDIARTDLLTIERLRDAQSLGPLSVLYAVQTLSACALSDPPKLWLVTNDASPLNEKSLVTGLAQSPLIGLGKNIALEYPDYWGGMVDLSERVTDDELAALVDELLDPETEDCLTIRGGERFVARLQKLDFKPSHPVAVNEKSTYLITGGLGGFGFQTARWFVERGAKHIVLLGRNAPSQPGTLAAINTWREQGLHVEAFQADVSRLEDIHRLTDWLAASWPPLKGIVHAAGLPGYVAMDRLTQSEFESLWAAKVYGTWNLHEFSRDMPLDFFVCVSSMVSLWGAKGQSHYVAANHFLDTLAQSRRAQGLPALTVNWGPMTGAGMLPEQALDELRRMGISTFPMDRAVPAQGILLGTDLVQTAVVHIDWKLFRGVYESKTSKSLFEGIQIVPDPGPVPLTKQRLSLRDRLRHAPEVQRQDLLLAYLQSVVANVLGLDADRIRDPRQGFFDMGMDSLTAMEFRNRLESDLQESLPSTLAFDYSTFITLAGFLQGLLVTADAQPVSSNASQEPFADESSLARLQDLTEEEAEALLLKKLEGLH